MPNLNFFDNLSLFATPTVNNHLVTKGYADSVLGTATTMKTVTTVMGTELPFTKSGQVFYIALTGNSTISVDVSNYTFGTNEIVEFTLIILNTGVMATFPSWSWDNGNSLSMLSAGWYVIHVVSIDSGASWLAKYEGPYAVPSGCKIVTTLSDATTHTGTSLRDAASSATNGNTILFAVSGTITLEQGAITLNQGVRVDGENKIVLDGNSTSRILNTKSSCIVENIVFFNADSGSSNGGAVLASGATTFNNCTFTNNTCAASGGAISAANYALTLNNCTFNGNTTTASANAYGGAVYSTSTLTATDCVFEENSATTGTSAKGGAICAASGTLNWTFTRCSFIGNSSVKDSGALNAQGSGTVTFTDCLFEGNTTTGGNCGVMHVGSSSYHPAVTISRCVFRENNCNYASGYAGVSNFNQCNSLDISDCQFISNGGTGSAPCLRFAGYASQGSLAVKRCLFTGNSGAKSTNGLIYVISTAVVSVSDCVFTGNTSSTTGNNCAVFYVSASGSSCTARNCTITNNTNWKAFRVASGSGYFYNCVDYGNQAASVMGGTYAIDYLLTNKTYSSESITHVIAYNSSLPLFESDGYTPSANSQVIDAGKDTYVTSTTDFNGEDRIQGVAVDLGAVEFLLPAIQGLSFSNNSPQSSPIIYQENTSYPVDELVEVEGVEQGDTVNYNVENFLYGGNDVPVIDTPGTYIVTVTVSRLGYRKSRSVNTVAIKKNTGTIQLVEGTIYAGDIGVVTASVSSDANGYLTCEINGETYTGTISNGTGAIELENIPAGTYPVTIVAHCTNYTDITTTDTISVIKWPGSLSLVVSDVDMGENIILSGFVPEDFDGIVSCTFEGTAYTVSPSGGTFTMYIPTTTSGEYTLVVYATGSSKYTDVSESAIIEVTDNRSNSTLTLSASDVYVGQNLVVGGIVSDGGSDGTVVIVLPDEPGGGSGSPTPCDFDGTATCTFEGNTYTATITDGEFTLSLPTTTAGSVTINVMASGSSSFKEATQSVSATVMALQTITGVSATGGSVSYDGDPHSVSDLVTVTGIQSGDTVTFSPTTVTTAGTHTVTVTVSRSGYADYVTTCDVTVSASATPLVLTLNTPSDIHYGVTATISGSVSPTGLTNGVATVVVDGVDTYTTAIESDGVFSESISGLTVGTHTIEVIVSADGCSDDSDEITITVTKITTATTASSPTVQYDYPHDVSVTATVRPSYGNSSDVTGSVRFVSSPAGMFQTVTASVINGRARGIVYIEAAGKYRYIAYYDGDDTHETSSGTGEISAGKKKTPIS